MSGEPEEDARAQELADVILPRVAGAMREAVEELGRQDSPMQEWAALREASPGDLRRVSQDLGMSLRESETGRAFRARMEAVNRVVDSAVEEWRIQREMSAEEMRQIRDQALRIVAAEFYQMFGIEIHPTDSCSIIEIPIPDKNAGQLPRTNRTEPTAERALRHRPYPLAGHEGICSRPAGSSIDPKREQRSPTDQEE